MATGDSTDTLKARRNFLNLCPTASQDEKRCASS